MHHTIIAVDVEGFGSRDGAHQTKVREGLLTAMSAAFERCRLPWDDCHREDRGDGWLLYLPPDVDSKRLVECLPNELAGCLRLHNATADDQARIRLRLVLHSGEVDRDRQGYSSPAVVHACRLLESGELKDALKRSSGILALITSDHFFRTVIMSNPAVDVGSYRRVAVAVKETRATAWICLPDHHGPLRIRAGHGQHRETRRRAPVPAARRRFPGGVAMLAVLLLAGGLTENVFAAVPPEDRCVEPVQLNVNVSAEKEQVIRELSAAFEDAEHGDGCAVVTVQVTVARSADAVITAIAHGWAGRDDLRDIGPEPHVLLPDSSWEFAAADAMLRTDGGDDVSLDNLGSIASSPLVLARPREGDAVAGRQPRTWKEVLATARQAQRPSPVATGTGLAATIALYSAELGEDLDRETLRSARAARLLRGVELAIPAGNDIATLLCSPFGGPVLVSEKVAGDYNEGSTPGGQCAPREDMRLELTYPIDGTPYLDHPFVAVTWHDRPPNPRRAQVVRRFHEFLTSPDGQDALRRARFRDRDGDGTPFAGSLRGRPRELDVGTVDVPAVLETFRQMRRPARVQILVDVSETMAGPFLDVEGTRLRAAANAIEGALSSVDDRDEVGLWEFAAGLGGTVDYRVLVPVGPGGAEKTRTRLADLDPSTLPARLSTTLRAAVDGLVASRPAEADTSDAVLIVADGSAEPALEHLRLADELRFSGVPVFLIAFHTDVCGSRPWVAITEATGGACHEVADIADIDEALDGVATVLWGGGRG